MTQIKGTNVLAPVVPFDTTDTHASHEARYGKGGYRSVADAAERDAIPQLRREAGMLVLTLTDGKFWRLASDLAAWSEISLAGPQGPQGVPGVAGPQGPAGVAGARGDTGATGSQGVAGVPGPQGIPGVAGAAGATGATGSVGPQGPAGVAGAAGVKGDRGDVGPQGIPGVAGAAGVAGPQGVPGVAGAKGDTGERGPAGPAGEAGPQGIQGVAGPAGAVGATGSQGIQGPAGVAGQKGDTGDVGPQGIQGVAGAKGDRGDVGPSGATGAQGPQGVAGATGSVGPAGATGATGPQASLVYASINDFPATGSSTALYLDESSSRLYQWESPVYVEVGTSGGGIATTSASALVEGTLADARLSANVVTAAALLARFSMPTTAVETFPRMSIGFLVVTGGAALYSFFTPLATVTVSQITMLSGGTAAAGLTLARMGLFTYDETSGTATLVARCASDTTLFTATRTAYTRSFDTAGSFPSSYQLVAGTRYGIALLCVGTTMPTIQGNAGLAEMSALTPRLTAIRTSQSDLSTGTATNAQSQVLYARLT